MCWLFSIALCLATVRQGISQINNKIDSLEQLVISNKEDTSKLKAFIYLCYEYSTKNPDKAVEYGNKGLALAKKLNHRNGIAKSFHVLGGVYRRLGEYQRSIDYYQQECGIKEELGDKKGVARCLVSIARVHGRQSSYEKEIDYYLQALAIYEEIDDREEIANCLNKIGGFYKNQDNDEPAIDYYQKSLKVYEELNNKDGIADNLGDIGYLYMSQSNYKTAMELFRQTLNIYRALENNAGMAHSMDNIGRVHVKLGELDSALVYLTQSLIIKEELGNLRRVASGLRGIGFIYEDMQNYKKAIECFENSLIIDTQLKDKQGMALAMNNIGRNYSNKGQYKKAIEYLEKSLSIAQEIGVKKEMEIICRTIVKSYVQQTNYEKAFEYQQLYVQIKDSLFNEEKSKEIGRLEASFDYERQILEQTKEHEKQEALTALELKRQRIITYSFIGGFGLVLILAVVMYRNFRQKKKANLLLEEQNEIIEEKNKDITDSISYAKNIQNAILPGDEEIRRVFPNHFVFFEPKDIVSGDFYWYSNQNRRSYIAACDCTGHGVPGAFVSMIGNDLLNQIIIERGVADPGEILSYLSDGVKSVFTRDGSNQQAQDGMDMVLCSFDQDLKTLEYAGAKNPLFIIQNGELMTIKGDNCPIGGDTATGFQFTTHKITLQNTDSIYLISDGFQDQFGGPKGKKFMIKRFKEILLTIQKQDMHEQKEVLRKAIDDWKGTQEQVDDICVIGIRV